MPPFRYFPFLYLARYHTPIHIFTIIRMRLFSYRDVSLTQRTANPPARFPACAICIWSDPAYITDDIVYSGPQGDDIHKYAFIPTLLIKASGPLRKPDTGKKVFAPVIPPKYKK